MPRRKRITHVGQHLEHIQLILDQLQTRGMTPLLEDEIRKASLINRTIIRQHAGKDTRKDIYVQRTQP